MPEAVLAEAEAEVEAVDEAEAVAMVDSLADNCSKNYSHKENC